MSSTKSICVASVKGGVGKTTTAYALLAAATARGMTAVALDLDGARGLTRALQLRDHKPTILDVLTRRATIEEAVVVSSIGAFAVPGDQDLYKVGFQDEALHHVFEEVSEEADLVVIDTHPGDNRLQVAFDLADVVVVPTIPNENDFDIAAETLRVAEEAGALPRIGGILPSVFRANDLSAMQREVLNGLAQLDIVYPAFLPAAKSWPRVMAEGKRPPKPQMKEAEDLLDAVLTHRCNVANLKRFLRYWDGADKEVLGEAV